MQSNKNKRHVYKMLIQIMHSLDHYY